MAKIAPNLKYYLTHKGTLTALFLWALLWMSIDTGPWQLRVPDFPQNTRNLIEGVRALFPFLAAYVAFMALVARLRSAPWILAAGPLGLMFAYALIGLLSSFALSPDLITSLYWGGAYAAVFPILIGSLSGSNTLLKLHSVINLNWIAVAAVMLITFRLFANAVNSNPVQAVSMGMPQYRLSGEYGVVSSLTPNGLGRYAAVTALVALSRLIGLKRQRILWFILLLISIAVLYSSRSRAAGISFVFAALLVLWMQRRKKAVFLGAFLLLIPLSLVTGYVSGEGFGSGRYFEWYYALTHLIVQSPVIGSGFFADRLFLEGTHIHDSYLLALAQSGAIGALFFTTAIIMTWVFLFRLRFRPPASLPPEYRPYFTEAVAVIAFFTLRSFAEGTAAFFGVDLLVLVPLMAYVHLMYRMRKVRPAYPADGGVEKNAVLVHRS